MNIKWNNACGKMMIKEVSWIFFFFLTQDYAVSLAILSVSPFFYCSLNVQISQSWSSSTLFILRSTSFFLDDLTYLHGFKYNLDLHIILDLMTTKSMSQALNYNSNPSLTSLTCNLSINVPQQPQLSILKKNSPLSQCALPLFS